MRKPKCEGDCRDTAKYTCEDCGSYYCGNCAEQADYECDCQEPPRLIPLHKGKKKKP